LGLTENQKRLIQAVSLNDAAAARKFAVACVEEDKTTKNELFCKKYKSLLEGTKNNAVRLPHDLKNILSLNSTCIFY